MNPSERALTPYSLGSLPPAHPLRHDPEIAALLTLRGAGFSIAPLRIVEAEAEESFYRLNNLPARLNHLFSGVDPADPDEDDIEELAPEAQHLVYTNFLLDEWIDGFYESLASLPGTLRLRHPSSLPGHTAVRGRPALLALKALWAQAWSFERLMARLEREEGIALVARPVLVAPSGLEPAPSELDWNASELLERDVALRLEPSLGVTAVTFL